MDPVGLITSILAPFFIVGLAFVAFIVFVRNSAHGLSKDARRGASNFSVFNYVKSAVIAIHELINRNKTGEGNATKSGAEVRSISKPQEIRGESETLPAISQNDESANK